MKPILTVKLTKEENKDYGEWHRLGLANAHPGDIVAENEREGYLTVGLLANCSSLPGVASELDRRVISPEVLEFIRSCQNRTPCQQ